MSYIKNQLARIKKDPIYRPHIQITGPDSIQTNHLTLDPETAKELIDWLASNFVKE